MQYVLQYFDNKKWDIQNTRNNDKSDSAGLIRGLHFEKNQNFGVCFEGLIGEEVIKKSTLCRVL